MVFLPESFDYIAANSDVASRLAEPLEGPRMTRYRHLAKDNDIWLSLGGFHEKAMCYSVEGGAKFSYGVCMYCRARLMTHSDFT